MSKQSKLQSFLICWSLPLLTGLFAILRATSIIQWSWWLVFLPLLIWGGFLAVIFLIVFIAVVVKTVRTVVDI